MSPRWGAKVRGHAVPERTLFGHNLGEDWVVPREEVRYLVVQETSEGGLLTAFDLEGRVVGEKFAPSFADLLETLEDLHRLGEIDRPRPIPGTEGSALRYLDRGSSPPSPGAGDPGNR